jgi:plastocyanin
MKWQRVAALSIVAVAFVACSNEKRVGSAIDVEKLAEKNQALGGAKVEKSEGGGGFIGDTEKEVAEEKAQQQAVAANQAAQDAAAKEQEQKSAVAFAITDSGYDPYVIRVFVGGVISVTNRSQKAASVTADQGEFDSGMIAPGDTWTYKPAKAGKFNFHDEARPYVVGTLEVLAR